MKAVRAHRMAVQRAGDLFNWAAGEKLPLRIEKEFPLSEAAAAQRQLEGRKTKSALAALKRSAITPGFEARETLVQD